jgi:hypothetical protein
MVDRADVSPPRGARRLAEERGEGRGLPTQHAAAHRGLPPFCLESRTAFEQAGKKNEMHCGKKKTSHSGPLPPFVLPPPCWAAALPVSKEKRIQFLERCRSLYIRPSTPRYSATLYMHLHRCTCIIYMMARLLPLPSPPPSTFDRQGKMRKARQRGNGTEGRHRPGQGQAVDDRHTTIAQNGCITLFPPCLP